MTGPIYYRRQGMALVPLQRFENIFAATFNEGETYRLEEREERSQASHDHQFASLAEAWKNLPEDQAERFPTPDHLRKWCLIKAGFADHRSIVCSSRAEAQRVAAFVRGIDEYSVVTVSEAVVTIYTAQSQSRRAMGKKAFQESKDKVLEIAWSMCGMTPEEAAPHVGRAA